MTDNLPLIRVSTVLSDIAHTREFMGMPVYLDGAKVDHVVTADEVLGHILKVVMGADGAPKFVNDCLAHELIKGEVRIVGISSARREAHIEQMKNRMLTHPRTFIPISADELAKSGMHMYLGKEVDSDL